LESGLQQHTFKRVRLGENAFDPDGDEGHGHDDRDGGHIPRDFAPFNIQNIGGTLFVTYAKQNAAKHDDVAGDGLGFVEIFTTSGKHIGHLQHGSWLNSPWHSRFWRVQQCHSRRQFRQRPHCCLQRLHVQIHGLREES